MSAVVLYDEQSHRKSRLQDVEWGKRYEVSRDHRRAHRDPCCDVERECDRKFANGDQVVCVHVRLKEPCPFLGRRHPCSFCWLLFGSSHFQSYIVIQYSRNILEVERHLICDSIFLLNTGRPKLGRASQAGRRISVVRMIWDHVGPVRFRAPRQNYLSILLSRI